MKLELRKHLTARKFAFAVFVILVVYIGSLHFLNNGYIDGSVVFSGIQRDLSGNTYRKTTWFNMTFFKDWLMGAKRKKPIPKINLKDDITTRTIKSATNTTTPSTTTPTTTTTTTTTNTTTTTTTTSKMQPKTAKKHFICLKPMGRLGNLMFQYAASYGIARSKGMELIVSEKESIVKIFHIHLGSRVVRDTSMCKGVRAKVEVRASAFDKETIHFDNDKNIALRGYLQSYKYFENVSDELRRQFKFRDSIQNKAENVIRDIFQRHLKKQSNESRTWTFVSVHVRRGDMVNNPHGHRVAPTEYFHRTQNMFRSLYENVLFIVCSNDIKWCKANLQTENIYFANGDSPEVDMAIISSCNHTITSVGSYSWWAAWLSNGIVTYYYPPAKEGSALRTQYSKDYSDYFLPRWIKVQ